MILTFQATRHGGETLAAWIVRFDVYAGIHAALVAEGYVLRPMAQVRRVPGAVRLRVVWRNPRDRSCAVVTRVLDDAHAAYGFLAGCLAAGSREAARHEG